MNRRSGLPSLTTHKLRTIIHASYLTIYRGRGEVVIELPYIPSDNYYCRLFWLSDCVFVFGRPGVVVWFCGCHFAVFSFEYLQAGP